MEEGESSSRSVARDEIESFHVVTTEDKKVKRKGYLAKRDATKICLYDEQFTRWRQLKNDLNVKTDKELATLLLDNYSSTKQVLTTSEAETQTDESHQVTMETLLSKSPVLTSTPKEGIHRTEHPLSTPKRRRLSMTNMETKHGTQTSAESFSMRTSLNTGNLEKTLTASESDGSDTERSDAFRFQDDLPDLENMTLEEEVYDTQIEGHDDDGDVDDEEDGDSSDRGPCQSQVVRIAPVDIPTLEFCLVSTSAVMDLLHKLHGPMCKRRECNRELDFDNSFVGSCLVVHWSCSAGHFGGRWSAQPQCEGIRAGNLLLASAIPLSGNSYTKVGFLCKVMNLHFFSKNLYNQYQSLYIGPAVNDYWEVLRNDAWKEREDKEIILSSDGRNDSPGHSAQYCTYSFADMDTKCILELNIVDVREVEGRKSPNMERVGFERGLDKLIGSQMNIKEVVTDGHLEIGALM
ncbi:Hypothetical predicted protein, partial [Paramuricea clavata]